jgi:alpha-L-fucosidase
MSRRDHLRFLGTGATALAGSAAGVLPFRPDLFAAEPAILHPPTPDEQADRDRRMKWWHAARFGMFIHWGLYSVIGQHEWAMEVEGIPVAQYEKLAKHFTPKPHAAREWAKLAKGAGQKYMVMTSKHHEGFCNFETKLTNYCAPQAGVRARPGGGVCGGGARGRPARGLLLFFDGLASSGRRPLRHR